MKKIIFVLSTAFTGSTMLDLMLSNGEDSFSCGEVIAIFRPWREHHIKPFCGCNDPDCTIWQKLTQYGEKQFFTGLFDEFPQLNFAVDSSKNLSWLVDQNRYLSSKDYQKVYVLIWKEPAEYAYSCWKRGKSWRWEDRWVRYHSIFFSISDDWVSVKYSDLASNPRETLDGLCSRIGIPYFEGKENFWNGTFHTLFGSDSVKAHLLEPSSEKIKQLLEKRAKAKPNVLKTEIKEFSNHRKIYYDPYYMEKLPDAIKQNVKYRKKIDQIESVLEGTDFRETPGSSIFQRAKRIYQSSFWYPREKTLHWVLWQKTKLEMLTGIRRFRSANADGG